MSTVEIPQGYNQVKLKYGPYSASRLLVARCPARFYSKYVLKEASFEDTVPSARGSAIHEILQKISEAHVSGLKLSTPVLNSWLEQAIGKHPASYDQIKLIKDAANAYVGNPSPYLNDTTVCEMEVAVSLFEEETFLDDVTPNFKYVAVPYIMEAGTHKLNPDAFFGAKLDQISVDHELKLVTVMDHKSTPSASQNSDHDFQLSTYAWLASILYPGYHVRSVIHYAHPSLNFYKPPVYWSYEDLQDVEQEVRMRIKTIESFQSYPAVPSSHCDYCHMIQLCPQNIKLRELYAKGDINLNVNNVADMQRLAGEVRTTGALYDQLNKTLKVAIENNCPDSGIAIDGMWFGFKPGEEKVDWYATDRKIQQLHEKGECPFENLSDVLEKSGLTPNSFREWNNSKLKSLWRLNKETLIEALKGLIVTDRTTRFSGYKI